MKQILLIDHHDPRRDTREGLLRQAGYSVVTAEDFNAVEGHLREATFDLVIVAVPDTTIGQEAVAYSKRLRAINARLPILALSDNGLFMPKETLVAVLQGGYPLELVSRVASMLLESAHVRNYEDHEI